MQYDMADDVEYVGLYGDVACANWLMILIGCILGE
jgi:hypothetical protein